MYTRTATLLLACLIAAAGAAPPSSSPQSSPSPSPAPSNALADALAGVNKTTPNLNTFAAAVQASSVGGSYTNKSTWTILAPDNGAFNSRLRDLGLTPAQLLEPANKATLDKVLSYHIIPSQALTSSQLKNGENLTTLLSGAAPLTVSVKGSSVTFTGATNSAKVTKADIKVGNSVIHAVNDVLVPANVTKASPSPSPAAKTATNATSPAASPAVSTSPSPSPKPSGRKML